MNVEELVVVLDGVNKEIEKEEKEKYVVYNDGVKKNFHRFFSMNCPEKEAWLEGIRKNEQA